MGVAGIETRTHVCTLAQANRGKAWARGLLFWQASLPLLFYMPGRRRTEAFLEVFAIEMVL